MMRGEVKKDRSLLVIGIAVAGVIALGGLMKSGTVEEWMARLGSLSPKEESITFELVETGAGPLPIANPPLTTVWKRANFSGGYTAFQIDARDEKGLAIPFGYRTEGKSVFIFPIPGYHQATGKVSLTITQGPEQLAKTSFASLPTEPALFPVPAKATSDEPPLVFSRSIEGSDLHIRLANPKVAKDLIGLRLVGTRYRPENRGDSFLVIGFPNDRFVPIATWTDPTLATAEALDLEYLHLQPLRAKSQTSQMQLVNIKSSGSSQNGQILGCPEGFNANIFPENGGFTLRFESSGIRDPQQPKSRIKLYAKLALDLSHPLTFQGKPVRFVLDGAIVDPQVNVPKGKKSVEISSGTPFDLRLTEQRYRVAKRTRSIVPLPFSSLKKERITSQHNATIVVRGENDVWAN